MKITWLPREYLDALYGIREQRDREVEAMHSFAFRRDIGDTVCSSSSPLERPEFSGLGVSSLNGRNSIKSMNR